MVDLKYNLDEIQDFALEPGKYLARLTKVEQTLSKAKKPMLVWYWKIISGEEKGSEIKSWTSLQDNALANLKTHLEAFGFSGKVNTKTSRLIGKKAVLIVGVTSGTDQAGEPREYSNVIGIKSAKAAPEEDIEDEDEDWDEEIEDEDEDEDWEDDTEDEEDEDEIEEEEPTPKKKRKKRRKSKGKLPF